MKITLAVVGRAGRGPEADLVAQYAKRLAWSVDVVEVEERRPIDGPARQASEAEKLLAAIPDGSLAIALDERGRQFASLDFARQIEKWQLEGQSWLCFVIGGADGLTDRVRNRCRTTMSLGKATWPHLMARAMLMEQVYRASTILQGHPYHRA